MKKLLIIYIATLLIVLGLFIISVLDYTSYNNLTSPFLGADLSSIIFQIIIYLLPILFILLVYCLFNFENPYRYSLISFDFNRDMAKSVDYNPIKLVNSSQVEEENKVKDNKIKKAQEPRFFMLNKIDREMVNYVKPQYNDNLSLAEICAAFRAFSAAKLKLYYDILDIRRFIAGLSVTKLLILQGMSGTGKTSLAYAFGEFLGNKTVVVPIQPMWKERSDLIGYFNEFTKRFNETTLLYKMYEANLNDEIYVTVLDEMNIARIEYYFAEFLSLLELPNPDSRYLDVVSDTWDNDPKLLRDGKLKLPENMWFVGTANNDDSTFAISDKVYDRAMILNLDKKADVFSATYSEDIKISYSYLINLYNKALRENTISDRNLRRLEKLDKYLQNNFQITFGNRIMKQIRSYIPVLLACGGTELEGLDDILARKVLRKLENKNPVYIRQMANNLINYINDLFGENVMVQCLEVIKHIEQNV